jgi:hypothetical protein
MVRQISMADFPASWEEARSAEHSHESRLYTESFMLGLDESSHAKLQHLVAQLHASRAAMIRHLIAQANPADFLSSWQLKAAERRTSPTQQAHKS